jgi:hypothetical protein
LCRNLHLPVLLPPWRARVHADVQEKATFYSAKYRISHKFGAILIFSATPAMLPALLTVKSELPLTLLQFSSVQAVRLP